MLLEANHIICIQILCDISTKIPTEECIPRKIGYDGTFITFTFQQTNRHEKTLNLIKGTSLFFVTFKMNLCLTVKYRRHCFELNKENRILFHMSITMSNRLISEMLNNII